MKRNRNLCYAIAALLLPVSAAADKGDFFVGAGVHFASYQFNEPEFTSVSTSVLAPSITGEWHISNIDSVGFGIRIIDERVGSQRPNSYGVTVDGQQFYIDYSRRLRISRHFKPWVGIGLVTNTLESTSKYRTDDEGYLLDTFSDRKDTELAVTVFARHSFALTDRVNIVPYVSYDFAIGDSPEGAALGVTLNYALFAD